MLGSRIVEAFSGDPYYEMIIMVWRREAMNNFSSGSVERCYNEMKESFLTKCRVDRAHRNGQSVSTKAAATKSTGKNKKKGREAESRKAMTAPSPKSSPGGKGKRKGKGKWNVESFKGICNYDRMLCGRTGHRREDCHWNPQSKNYKGEKWCKEQIAAKVKALEKVGGKPAFGYNKNAYAATHENPASRSEPCADEFADLLDVCLHRKQAMAARQIPNEGLPKEEMDHLEYDIDMDHINFNSPSPVFR